jgi:large subunit ribosomal protein L35
MPKMKTNRAAAKRFRVTGTGKLMREKAFRRHLLEAKSSVRTRRLSKDVVLSPGDAANVKKMLGL